MAEESDMSEVANGRSGAVAVSKPKPPAPGQETTELLKRATRGEKGCLPEVRALFGDGEYGEALRELNGSSAEWLRRSLIEKSCGKNILIQEAIVQKLDSLKASLEGSNLTPIERLLAERTSLCWFIVNRYENAYANAEGWSITHADLQQRKIDKAHARFLSSLLTLARVRKLALPTLQVNIGQNQVNMAEPRP
jgi:hypothetical protein